MIKVTAENGAVLTGGGKAIIGGAAVSVPTGLWGWLGENHSEIGALCAIIGAAVAVGGYITTLIRSQSERDPNMRERADD